MTYVLAFALYILLGLVVIRGAMEDFIEAEKDKHSPAIIAASIAIMVLLWPIPVGVWVYYKIKHVGKHKK